MKARLYARLSGLLAVAVGLFAAPVANAQRVALLPSCTVSGNCTLCDFFTLAANISQFILTLIGTVTVAMVVLGGLMWLVSGGSSERISQGKKIITGAFIGLGITMGAYLAVNSVILGFLGGNVTNDKNATVFGEDWNAYCTTSTPSTVLTNCSDSSGPGSKNYAVACNTDGCSDPSVCVCYENTCMTYCQAIVAEEAATENSSATGQCITNAEECGGSGSTSYYVNAGGTQCPTTQPYCCITGSITAGEADRQQEESEE